MGEEIADLGRRVELLEEQVNSLQHGLSVSQTHLEIVTGWRQADREANKITMIADQDAGFDTVDPNFGRVESMLRSVLEHQSHHSATLGRVLRALQLIIGRKAA